MDVGELTLKINASADGAMQTIQAFKESLPALGVEATAAAAKAELANQKAIASYNTYKQAVADLAKAQKEAAEAEKKAADARQKAAQTGEEAAKKEAEAAEVALKAAKEQVATLTQQATEARKASNEAKAAAEAEKKAADEKAKAEQQAAAIIQQAESGNTAAYEKTAETAKETSDQQVAAFAIVAAAAKQLTTAIVSSVNAGIDAYNQYIAAMQGLQSVASGKGIATSSIEDALEGLTDQFFSAADAAASLKNLLSRGYTLDQAINTITRLKDAAAFGRQANYELAAAVVTATEGIKNENSILVDNAGVQKNLAKMWEDYAKARGISTTSLTQAQKVEAEYLGIMEETKLQVGDLTKLQDTLAGSQANAANSTQLLQQAFGEAMSSSVGAATEVYNGFVTTLRGLVETFPGVTAGATSAAAALGGFAALGSALQMIKKLAASLTALKAATPIALGAAVAIGAFVTLYTKMSQATAEAAQAEKDRIASIEEAAASTRTQVSNLDELYARYLQLANGRELTASETKELVSIENQLAAQHGVTAGNAETLTEKNLALAESYKKVRQEEAAAALAASKSATQEARFAAYQSMGEALDAYAKKQELVADLSEAIVKQQMAIAQGEVDAYNSALEEAEGIQARLASIDETYANKKSNFVTWLTKSLDEARTAAQAGGSEIGEELYQGLVAMVQNSFMKLESLDLAEPFIQDTYRAMVAAINAIDASDGIEAMQALNDKIMAGQTISFDEFNAVLESYQSLADDKGIADFFASLGVEATDGMLMLSDYLPDIATKLWLVSGGALSASEAFNQLNNEARNEALGEAEDSMEDFGKKVSNTQAKLDNLEKVIKNVSSYRKARQEYDKLSAAGEDTADAFSAMQKAAKDLGIEMEDTGESISDTDTTINALEQQLVPAAQAIQTQIDGLTVALQNAAGNAVIYGGVTMDVSEAQARINELQAQLNALHDLMSELGITTVGGKSGGGGGGGGGGKSDSAYQQRLNQLQHLIALGQADEARQLQFLREMQSIPKTADEELDYEERLYVAKEALRKKEIQDDYDMLDHKKAMGQLTLEEELAWLLKIKQAHELNAEERREIEEKLYDAYEAIRERDASSLDSLNDSVVSALQARYEAMKDAEIERLDESRQAWQDWADESVAAIQAQIDALDELASQEDREAKDAEELRKIANLQQQIQFEQDDYSRLQLQKQLDAAIQSREERLRKLEIQDQKDALQAEIDRIQETAQAEQDKLDQEQEAIEKAYEERLKDAALQAEAEKLIMTETQEAIIDLIGKFAPDYDALGQTFGERMLAGFQAKVSSIVEWFQGFNAGVAQAQENMRDLANQSAELFYQQYAARNQETTAQPVQIEQNNTFTVPVESPSDTARKVRQANEALALEIMRGG